MGFRGSMVALVTPMLEDGRIDEDGLARLVDMHVEAGTAGLVVAGTTGESPTLGTAEHAVLLARTVAIAAGRIPVIAGTGSNSTEQSLGMTEHAVSAGCDGVMLVVPYYNKPPQEGLVRHFSEVASSTELPVILYNVPGRTACDLLPETVARLAEVSNIVGIKEATGDLERVDRIRELCGDGFALLSGDDATSREFMLRGGDGVISVTANLVPEPMARMCEAALSGDADGAATIDSALAALHRDLFVQANPIPIKWAMARAGLIGPGIRLPLIPLEAGYHDVVAAAMTQAGVH